MVLGTAMMNKSFFNTEFRTDLLSVYIKNHLSFFYIPVLFSVILVSAQFYFLGNIDQERIIASISLFLLSACFFVNQQRMYKNFLVEKNGKPSLIFLFKIMTNKACYVLPWLFIIFWPYKTEYLFDLSLGFLTVFLAIGFYTAISSSNLMLLFYDVALQVVFSTVILILNWSNIEASYILFAILIFTAYSFWIGGKLNKTVKNLVDSNKKLELKTQEANRANRAKSDFLAMISHEIRTPLHGINSTVEGLHDTRLNKRQKESLNIISRCSDTLLSMLNDVLDLSKIEAKKISIEKVEFDFYELISDVIGINSGVAEKKNITLQYEISQEVPQYIVSDPTRINQIILNLISNAIKFTQKGHVHLHVAYNESNNLIMVKVQDTGIGIYEENIDRIFSAFEQEDFGTTRNFGGSGLGLPIVKELVTLLNGDIRVESQKRRGSTFIVDIPVVVSRGAGTIQEKNVEKQAEVDLSNCRILVAEDNKVNRMNIDQTLRKCSCVADLVCDGLETVHQANQKEYDIILMDINMPNLNGIEATQKIQETRNSHTPIIGLSAATQEETIHELYLAGIVDHVIKPFDRFTFMSAIDRYKPADLNRTKEKIDQIYEDFEESFCVKYLNESFAEIDRLYAALKNAINQEKMEEVYSTSHEICGICGNIGMYQTYAQSKNIEDLSSDKAALFILFPKVEKLAYTIGKEVKVLKEIIKNK